MSSNSLISIHDHRSRIIDSNLTAGTILPLILENNPITYKELTTPCMTTHSKGRDLTNLCPTIKSNNEKRNVINTTNTTIVDNISTPYTTFNQTFYYHNMKFYRYLTPSTKQKRINLLDSEPITNDTWIFSIQPPKHIGGNRAFTVTRDLPTFINNYFKIPEIERNYYEVIRSGIQKPHFDIDGSLEDFKDYDDMVQSTDNFLQLVLLSIEHVLHEYNVDYDPKKSLLVFPSNGPDKRSYHIVIDYHVHSSNKEAEAFYHLVDAHLTTKYAGNYNNKVILDPKVYNSRQQFRLFGSQKIDSNRPKKLAAHLSRLPRDPKIYVPLDDVFATMVSFVSGCQMLPTFIRHESIISKIISNPINDIEESAIMDVVNAYKYSKNYKRVCCDKDYIISFSRVRPAYCQLCNRVHDSVGAFVSVGMNGSVWWNCHADKHLKPKEIIGHIDRITSISEDNDDGQKDDTEEFKLEDEFGLGMIEMFNSGKVDVPESIKGRLDDYNKRQTKNNNDDLVNSYGNPYPMDTIQSSLIQWGNINTSHIPSFINNNRSVATGSTDCETSYVPGIMDNLIYFTKYHITYDYNSSISIDEILEKYKLYCNVNNIRCQYTNDNTVNISKHLRAINQNFETSKKQKKGVRQRFINGYMFINLDKLNINLEIKTSADPVAITNKILINKEANRLRLLYESMISTKLRGNHKIDMSPILPKGYEIIGDREEFALFLKAACGMGKTELIMELLRQAKSFIIVIGRILLGKKLEDDCVTVIKHEGPNKQITWEKIKRADFYSDIKGKAIKSRRCITTIDSLHRITTSDGKPFEYAIFDEFGYTISQLVNFSKNKERNCNMLVDIIKYTPKIIVSDACLEQSTVDMVEKIRGRDDTIIYENHYPKHQDKEINVLANPGIFYSMIENSVLNGENIVIPMGSKETANALAEFMKASLGCKIYREDEVPEEGEKAYKIKVYTGDDKKCDNPTLEWKLYNAIIYTNVVEAGISFTDIHFDKCYGFFTARSFGPQSALQMLFRSRNYTTNKIYVTVMEGAKTGVPKNIKGRDKFVEFIKYQSEELREELREGIKLSYVRGADYTDFYFDMFTDVKYRDLIGKRRYLVELLRYCKEQGMRFGQYIDDNMYREELKLEKKEYGKKIMDIRGDIRGMKSVNKMNRNRKIAEAQDITDNDAVALRKLGDISKDDKNALIKHSIKTRFIMENVDEEFVSRVIDNLKAHTNTAMCKKLSEDISEEEKIIRMREIANNHIVEREKITLEECIERVKLNDEPSVQDLINGENLYNKQVALGKNKLHISEIIQNTERIKRYRLNMHAVNILRMMGIKDWLRNTEKLKYKLNIEEMDGYFMTNKVDFPEYKSVKEHGHERILKQINEVIDVFSMEIIKDGNVKQYWRLDKDNVVRPIM